jgi:hypothetical protein
MAHSTFLKLMLSVFFATTIRLVLAQEQLVLCENQNAKILQAGKQLVVDYTRLIETLTMSTEYEIQEKIKGKIFQLTESTKIQIEDDITSYAHQGRRFDLDDYLANIRNHVDPDADVRYDVSEPDQIYYEPNKKFYYTLVGAKKTVQNAGNTVSFDENFFVKISQIDKNLPILRISDMAMKSERQLQVGNLVRTKSCFVEIKPLRFTIPSAENAIDFKRLNSSAYSFEWEGGVLEDSLLIEMIRLDKQGNILSVDTLLNEYPNSGYYTRWFLGKQKCGTYKFRMTKLVGNDPSAYSDSFKVKRKMPLGYQIAIVPAVFAGAYIIYNMSQKAKPLDDLPEVSPLPTQ